MTDDEINVAVARKLPYHKTKRGREKMRIYRELHKSNHKEYKRRKRAEYALANPEKVRARRLLGNAIQKGFIPRPEANRTWHNHWEFHHPDHSRPYYGVWVTPSDHRLIDLGKKDCPSCKDWVSEVRNGVMKEWDLF